MQKNHGKNSESKARNSLHKARAEADEHEQQALKKAHLAASLFLKKSSYINEY